MNNIGLMIISRLFGPFKRTMLARDHYENPFYHVIGIQLLASILIHATTINAH